MMTSIPDLGTRLLVILAAAVTAGIVGAAFGFAMGPEDPKLSHISFRDVISGPSESREQLTEVREIVQATRASMLAFAAVGIVMGAGIATFISSPSGWDALVARSTAKKQAAAESRAAQQKKAAAAYAQWAAEQREAEEAREKARLADLWDVKMRRAMALAYEEAGDGDLMIGLERGLAALHVDQRQFSRQPSALQPIIISAPPERRSAVWVLGIVGLVCGLLVAWMSGPSFFGLHPTPVMVVGGLGSTDPLAQAIATEYLVRAAVGAVIGCAIGAVVGRFLRR